MTKQEAEKWLYDNQSQEGSPEFERVFAQYKGMVSGGKDPLKAAEIEYNTVNSQPDSPEKLAALDRLRTKITDLGGKPKLSDSSMVSSQSTNEEKNEAKPKEVKNTSGLPSQDEFDEFVREARKAQLMGGAAASLKYLPEVTQRVLGPIAGSISQAAEEGRLRARPPSNPPSISSSSPAVTVLPAQTGALSVVNQPSVVLDPRAPVQPTADQVTRQIQGTIKEPGTSMATTGRASQTTYQNRSTDIKETKQAQQAVLDALGKKTVLGPVPQGITASSPSGILVPQSALEPRPPGPVISPMATQQGPLIGPSAGPSGPQINPQTLRQLPMTDTSARPPVRSGLDQVRGAFTAMANSPLGQKVTDAAKVVGKGVGALGTVAAGAETGLNLYDMVDALQKDEYKRAALAGAKAAATGAMIRTPYGLIPAAAIYGTEWLNDATARAKMKALHGMSPQSAYESEGGFYVTPQ